MEHKNNKGLTLIEVLVSIVITILVMAYGLNLFIATWKLEVDSKEYNEVLQLISSKIEQYKNYTDPLQAGLGSANETITLSSGKTLDLTVHTYNKVDGSVPITVKGVWPSVAEEGEKVETIAVNTFLGTDEDPS